MNASVPPEMNAPVPRKAFRHRRPWVFHSGLGALVLLLLVVMAVGWFLGTTSGAAFLLSGAGLKAEGLQGSLATSLSAERIEYRQPRTMVAVTKPSFTWSPMGLLSGELRVDNLAADAIEFASAPPATKARAELPASLEPPLDIRVDKASIKRISIGSIDAGGKITQRFEISEFALRSVAGRTAWKFDNITARTPMGVLEASGSIGAVKPFPVDINVNLSGEREGRRYRVSAVAKGTLAKFDAVLKGAEGGITGNATASIEPLEDAPVKRVVGKLAGIDINAFAPAAPHTDLALDLDLRAGSDGAFTGPVRATNATPGPIDKQRVPVSEARGTIRILAPRYELKQAAIVFGASGSATGDVIVEGQEARAKLVVAGLDLSAWHTALRPTKLAGDLTAEASAKAQRFDVNLTDPRFAIVGKAAIENDRLTVETARVAAEGSSAVVQGTMELKGKRALDFVATLEHVDPSKFADAPVGDLNGKLRAKGTLEGGPAGEAVVDLTPSRIAGLALAGRATLEGTMKRISRADVDVTLADARLQAKGTYGTAGDVLDVNLVAPNLAPIAKAFKQDAAGSLNAQAKLTGTFAAPAGTLTASGEKLRIPGGYGASKLDVKLEVGSQADARAEGRVDVVSLTGSTKDIVRTMAERASITIAGTRGAHRITLDGLFPPESELAGLPTMPAAGTEVTDTTVQPRQASIVLAGGLVDKATTPTWKGRIEKLDLRGEAPMRLTAPADLTVSRERVELAQATLRGPFGHANLERTIWTPTRIEAKGNSKGLLLRPLGRALNMPARFRTGLVLAAEWDITAAETLDGHIRLRRIEGDMRVGDPSIAFGVEQLELSVEAQRGRVDATLALVGKQSGRLKAHATTTIRKEGSTWALPKNAPLTGDVEADVPTLAWAADLLGPDARLDGKLAARIALGGTLASPTYRGTVTADALQLHDSTLGFEIDTGTIAVALDEREVAIQRFHLESAWRIPKNAEQTLERAKVPEKGTISAEGRLDFAARKGVITVKAETYPVSQLPARFLAGTGEAKLEVGDAGLSLSGNFKADAGYIGLGATASPRISDDVLVDRGEGIEDTKARVNLDVRFQLGDRVYFEGRGLSTRLAGELRVRGDPGRTLVASGQIRTVRGNYDAYGQKLTIERGVLTFQGPLDNPQLNVLAVRDGLPVVAGVEVLGTVGRPQVRLYSRPEVPDSEKLSWLVLGRGPADAGEGDAATLFAAANALLGANSGNRKLVRQLGFDEVSIGRNTTGALGAMPQSSIAGKTGSTSGSEMLTVGKRLTKDLYVSYQQGLADAQASVKFAYTVSRRLQLLLTAGDKPGLDAVYRFTFGRETR
ncbi:Translocation and assembly module subunit TamB [Usitatibacter rugosus]|uniref:Translocation and assembly module subunit TamB n=1 Tax=Usitatibacter rugosus TaxID=2732067 RepID=A0A6M4H1M6_9PROT|nr:translocation/assembly module TamB domain-containing protein [Usitatibacter rugosus]QJR13028.1 Translocation and assembly module subunit TamB [Usitatibacter rugosus]